MFCPSCRDEFRADVHTCPDCEVELVPELLPEPPPRLLAIERTMDPDRLGAIVEALENAGVPYVLHAGTGLRLLDDEDDSAPRAEEWEARVYVPGILAASAAALLSGDAAATWEEESPEPLHPEALKKPFEPR